MELVKAKYEILTDIKSGKILKAIEVAGRTCYKSESKITASSAPKFVEMLIGRGHTSVLEHVNLSVRFTVDRGVSHELVRHRIASFSQESTRYCNYSKKGITFIIPSWVWWFKAGVYSINHTVLFTKEMAAESAWFCALLQAESFYNELIAKGWKPEQARSVLPNSLKTEIVVTANLREWRLIFKQRTSDAAHPQMREVMIPLLYELRKAVPIIFDNL